VLSLFGSQGRGSPGNTKFGREVSKVWPIIVPPESNSSSPEQFVLWWSSLTT